MLHAEVDDLARFGDTLTEHNIKLCAHERGRHLILHHLHLSQTTDGCFAILDECGGSDLDTHRRIELKRVTAGGGLRISEHHADLLTNLVDEDAAGAGARDCTGELTHGLRHKAGMETHILLSHLPFDLRFGSEGSHGVDHKHIDCA